MSIYIVARITLIVNASRDIFADSAFLSIVVSMFLCPMMDWITLRLLSTSQSRVAKVCRR